MNTWGPRMWKKMHVESLNQNLYTFAHLLTRVDKTIPCSACRQHFRAYAKSHLIRPNTDLVKWTIDFHNDVNDRLGKPQLSYPEAFIIIQNWKTGNNVIVVAAATAVVVALIWSIKE